MKKYAAAALKTASVVAQTKGGSPIVAEGSQFGEPVGTADFGL